jgi:formylglycine-generating enzyme required for sulfatase activity
MNRREFMQCVGVGGAGLSLSLGARAFTSFLGSTDPSLLDLQTVRYEAITVDKSGRKIALTQHQAQYFTQDLGGGETLDMISIPANRFPMGAAAGELKCGEYECLQHPVMTQALFMGKTQVTQTQWQAVTRLPKVSRDLDPNPSYTVAGNHPVECVSWLDAQEFCARLSLHSGMNYRLPSEAVWEGACRAGTRTPFNCGATITSELANYSAAHTYAGETKGSYRRSTTPVGQFLPNVYGLYDMHGNVWEWCEDHWHADYRGAPVDGSARVAASHPDWRALRGGAWADDPAKLRSASRSGYSADSLNRIIGFRVGMYT